MAGRKIRPAMTERRDADSVAVMVRLERALLGNAEILGLLRAQPGQLGADLRQMQAGDLFVEMLGQRVDLLLVLARIGPQLDLRQRSEEHTSELQSRENLVCRLLLEKKKKQAKVQESRVA